MDSDAIQQAITTLRAQGEPVTGPKIRELMGGKGSYRDIYQYLRGLEGEELPDIAEELTPDSDKEGEGLAVAAEPVVNEDITDAPQAHAETALAVPAAENEAVDFVADAQAALARAQQRLQEAETRVPELERQLAELRQALLQATLQHLTVAYAASKGLLSTSDPGVADAEKAMWEAGRAHRQAKERLDQAPQAIASARGAVRLAQQQVFLAQHHPELVQALTEAEARRPTEDRGPDTYREWALWKQEVSSARACLDAVIAQAGL
jgi:hypothetical protein